VLAAKDFREAVVKTIVISTAGTLGDHLPFIALGQALQVRGYRVRMVLNPAMQDIAVGAGLDTTRLPDIERGAAHARQHAGVWDHWPQVDGGSSGATTPDMTLDDYIAQAQVLATACRDADLLIATSIRVLGYVAQQIVGLPWLTASMNPAMFGPTAGDSAPLIASMNALVTRMTAALGGTPPSPIGRLADLYADQILLASSRHFSQPDVRSFPATTSVVPTGFWFYQDPTWADWQPDAPLAAFMSRSPRPIVLSFSSQPLVDPHTTLAVHARAAQALGYPLLVQQGWAGFTASALPNDVDPANVFFTDFLSHDWLFAHAACAIQHGGIGSIARALRHGCPLLIEPYGNDQFFNARRVLELGVGASMHPHKLTVDGLVRVIGEKVLDPAVRRRAQEIGTRIANEDGLSAACDAIERRFLAPPPRRSPAPPIPRTIHQTWKTIDIPPRWQAYQSSWQAQHPDWQYRLWTDAELRDLIATHYAWFLPIYDSYPEAIMRVDAARYFVLHQHGGVYADLDYECLRSFDTLLRDQRLVLGLEPAEHLDQLLTRATNLPMLVGNAIMASTPNHPFWEHIFDHLVANRHAPNALDATGPYMLTRAYAAYADQPAIRIEPEEVLYPLGVSRPWAALSAADRQRVRHTAYGIHHWHNTWVPDQGQNILRQISITLLEGAQPAQQHRIDLNTYTARGPLPRISCLMVTHGRAHLALRAIHCFRTQTYPNRELIIVDDDPDDRLARALPDINDPRIVHIRLPDEGRTLGDLRNVAVQHASGTFIAQWDDDDLSDPERLAIQMAAINTFHAEACMLQRHTLWWPERRRMAVSNRRAWEGSLLCARARLPRYPDLPKGEDTPVVEQIVRTARVALLDAPQLYTYVFHGENTHTTAHWDHLWRGATAIVAPDAYPDMVRSCVQRHRLDTSEWRSGEENPRARQCAEGAAIQSRTAAPRVLIVTPVKDAVEHLPRFFANLDQLTYPHDRLSLAVLESDSTDDTYARLQRQVPKLQAQFDRVHVFKHDYGYRLDQPRWLPSVQRERRSILAQSRNHLLRQALHDEDWVLWIDVDLHDWPSDVIEQLLAVKREIVVPNCVVAPAGRTFDYNTFRCKPNADLIDWSQYLVDDLLQPPIAVGRHYLNDLRAYQLVEVDAVGGTMLLVRADLHRRGLIFPETPYHGLIETEGLARMAQDMGHRCWGVPHLEIIHPPH
jgi:UDP:flavonoid glycosyltransferase YjiC (YdhE family)/GT2 family glycosyltransferase